MLELMLVVAVAQAGVGDRDAEKQHSLDLSKLTVVKPQEPRHVPSLDRVHCVPVLPGAGYDGPEVQAWCDSARRECLLAPTYVLDEEGKATTQPVQRTTCGRADVAERLAELAQQGYQFVWARANAPNGWYRDELGRVMQANFDFTRRVYVGGGYSPFFRVGDPVGYARGRVDFGLAVSFAHDQFLHQLRIAEGQVWVGQETRLDAALIRYWWSVKPVHPPLYLTTFGEKPHRFDLPISFSAAFETLRFEVLPQRSFLTLSSASLLMDLWHAPDLESYMRVRLGAGAEVSLGQLSALSARPEAALEGDFTLDRDGFHHLQLSVTAEKVLFEAPGTAAVAHPWRVKTKLGYEAILLAINDYPLTLVLDGRAAYREDLVTAPTRWEFSAHAGLRFSLWAPARRSAPPMTPPAPPAPPAAATAISAPEPTPSAAQPEEAPTPAPAATPDAPQPATGVEPK